ncbi:MAG: hypothetical protein PHH00_03870 [Candidatus Nanoarchaeia archaeon]|nr:hypothetical protein [Candidatus Nanoarchaeia archaeon]
MQSEPSELTEIYFDIKRSKTMNGDVCAHCEQPLKTRELVYVAKRDGFNVETGQKFHDDCAASFILPCQPEAREARL